jgi:integrase
MKKIRSPKNPNGYSPHVVRVKECLMKHLRPWATMHYELVTPQFVTDELDRMEANGMSRSLTNHLLKQVKCVFSFALNCGVIQFNPFTGMKMRRMPKKRKQALNHEEVKLLLGEAKARKHPYYEIWLLTIGLGLRRSELAGLMWTDVDFGQGLIYLQRQLVPREGIVPLLKDREDRVVSIPNSLVPILKEMKLKSKSEFVISVKCHMWRDGHQAKIIRQFCREIGLKEVTHHQLRATHITLALVNGVPLGIVKENVGHAKLSTTDQYFRSAGIDMRGQMNGLQIPVPQIQEGIILPLKKGG